MKKILAFVNRIFSAGRGIKKLAYDSFLSLLALIMIGSGHSADNKVFEIQLHNDIKRLKSQFVEGRSLLMEQKMETKISAQLAERGVKPATTPPIKIIVE